MQMFKEIPRTCSILPPVLLQDMLNSIVLSWSAFVFGKYLYSNIKKKVITLQEMMKGQCWVQEVKAAIPLYTHFLIPFLKT